MSYILDALNKSEQERRARSGPDLHSLHAPAPATHTSSRRGWIIGGLLIGLNLAALGYWLLRPEQPVQTVETSPASAQPAELAIAEPITEPVEVQPAAPVLVAPATVATQQPPSEDIITPTDLGAAAKNRLRSTIGIAELPVELQRQLPAMRFSSHLYSEDFRLVNINGQMMREGETISPGVILLEITVDGVVVEFRDRAIEMSVLRDWSFN